MAVPIEPALIEGLPTREVTLTFHGERQVCSGPLLADVLADRCNGTMLGEADGPFRIAVAGDTRGARSVRQAVSLRLSAVP